MGKEERMVFALLFQALKVVDAPFVYNKCPGTYTSTHVLVGNARCEEYDSLGSSKWGASIESEAGKLFNPGMDHYFPWKAARSLTSVGFGKHIGSPGGGGMPSVGDYPKGYA